MSDRTGMARGNLKPILYYENSGGHIILAAHDEGDPTQARRMYEQVYKPKGYEWREASSWPEWERLQKRLVDQEARRMEFYRGSLMANYDAAARMVRDQMYQRMTSAACSEYEREFIQGWLALKEEKRSKYEALWRQHHDYLWAVEQDSTKKIDDVMKGENAI